MHALIYVRIVYAGFRVLDGRIRPIERKLRALGAWWRSSPRWAGMPSLHELHTMMLEEDCMHPLLIAKAHLYDKIREFLLGAICRSSQT